MYVWPEYRFAFLAMPATGSVAVSRALMRAGARCVVGHHKTPAHRPDMVAATGWDETWTTATTVRDPVSWFASMWKKGALGSHMLSTDPLTVDWIHKLEEDTAWFDGTGNLWWQYVPYATVLWNQKTLQADMDTTMAAIGAPKLPLETWNVSLWREPTVTPEALAYIRSTYAPA